MDQNFKFSPSNIERCESAFMLEHDQAMGYRPPPFARNVKAKTAWEELRYAFPAPIDIQLRMDRMREERGHMPERPRYDCFQFPCYKCVCFKCQMHVKQEVDYYEAIQDDNKRMWTPPAAVHALSVLNKPDEYVVEQEHFPCVKAHRVKHLHKCQPSWNPNVIQTPWFSEVYYSSLETPPMTPRKHWVKYKRLEVTPTHLIFPKKN